MSTPPDLAEAERTLRALATLTPAAFGYGAKIAYLAEFDRRGTAERELESRLDGKAWADLEAERDRLSRGLRGMAGRASDMRRTAAMVMDYVAARSTPGAPQPEVSAAFPAGAPRPTCSTCGFVIQSRPYTGGWEHSVDGYYDHPASPGADTPADPTGTAALLALCAALDCLPASEGGSGPTLAVDEIRRLLRSPDGAS